MKAACHKVDITPAVGTPIGGNVREDNVSRGVHDRLFANFLYLDDGKPRVLFIGLDVIAIPGSLGRNVKEGIRERTGIAPADIVLFATHTHSGPDVMEAFKDEYDPLIADYLEALAQKLIDGATDCACEPWDAEIGFGKGTEDGLSFNRRILMKDGTLRMNWEDLDPKTVDRPAGPIDPDLYVVSVRDRMGQIRSILVNFTLHTAVLVGKEWLFSRDYVHSLTERLEDKFGKQTVVLFANGAEGNINHIDISRPDQPRGFEETERIGSRLALKAADMIERIRYEDRIPIQTSSQIIKFPRRKVTDEQAEAALRLLDACGWKIPSLLDGVPDEAYAKEILALHRNKAEFVETELQAVQLGDCAVVSLPGEFFVEQGLAIKKQSPYTHTMIFGLANDCIGYVPTERAFDEGGYEIKTARTSQLAPQAGDMAVREAAGLLTSLKGGDGSEVQVG